MQLSIIVNTTSIPFDVKNRIMQSLRNQFSQIEYEIVEVDGLTEEIKTTGYLRNLGVKKSKGETIVFLDRGFAPENTGWLDTLTMPIRSGAKIVIGDICYYDVKTKFFKVFSEIVEIKNNMYKELSFWNFSNCAMKRSLFYALGGFGINEGCDLDFSLKTKMTETPVLVEGSFGRVVNIVAGYNKTMNKKFLEKIGREWRMKSFYIQKRGMIKDIKQLLKIVINRKRIWFYKWYLIKGYLKESFLC